MTDLIVQKPHAARGRSQEALQLQTMTMGVLALDVAMIGEEPWFYAPSLAKTLGYKDAFELLRSVEDDEKQIFKTWQPRPAASAVQSDTCTGSNQVQVGQRRDANFVNEWGLYRVVSRSNSANAKPFQRWVWREVLPSLRKTGQYKMHQDAQRMGVSFDFTEDQWAWLKLRPYMVDLLVLAAGGYNSVEITRMLNYNTLTGITARKQIDKLKELGFLPKVIEPRAKQLERRIKAKLAAAQQAPLPALQMT